MSETLDPSAAWSARSTASAHFTPWSPLFPTSAPVHPQDGALLSLAHACGPRAKQRARQLISTPHILIRFIPSCRRLVTTLPHSSVPLRPGAAEGSSCSLADSSQHPGKASSSSFQIQRWRNLKSTDLVVEVNATAHLLCQSLF